MIHGDVDRAHRAHLVVVGDRRDRALLRLEHDDAHARGIGQERAAPAPRAERAIGVSAISGALIGMIGPWTERL